MTLNADSIKDDPIDYSKYEGRTIQVLGGDWDDNLLEILSDCISEFSTDLKIDYSIRIAEIYSLAIHKKYDFAFLYLNNVQGEYGPLNDMQKYCEERLQLVRYLCSMGIPVIALYGYPQDTSFADKVIEAGATFASFTPFRFYEFQKAVEYCLSKSG
jgi:hypothetical protein